MSHVIRLLAAIAIVLTAKYRYAEWDGGSAGVMLLDAVNDPTESRNLADDPKYAKVREEMAALAKRLAATR